MLLPLQAPEGKGEVVKDSPWKARMRYAKIGGAAVAGGAILGLTGRTGLALPCLLPHPCTSPNISSAYRVLLSFSPLVGGPSASAQSSSSLRGDVLPRTSSGCKSISDMSQGDLDMQAAWQPQRWQRWPGRS